MVEELGRSARAFAATRQTALAILLMVALAAVAVSAATAVTRDVLVNPLHVDRAGDLVVLKGALPTLSGRLERAEDFLDYAPLLRGIASAAGYSEHDGGVTLTWRGRAARANGAEVTPAFFSTIGVAMRLGRGPAADERLTGRNRVIVIGDDLSRSGLFAGDDIVGQSVTVNGVPFTVIGIAAEGFRFPRGAEFWIPISLGADRVFTGQAVSYGVIGRLTPGVSMAGAQRDLALFARDAGLRVRDAWPARREMRIVALADAVVGEARTALRLVVLALGLVWFAAAANIAALLLTRAAARDTEMMVRRALGASPARLVRHFVADGVLVAGVTFLCGVAAALTVARALLARLPAEYAGAPLVLTGGLVGLIALLSLVTGGVSVLPAMVRTGRSDRVDPAMLAGTRTASARSSWRRAAFTVAQTAVAMVLVGGSVGLASSVIRLSRVTLGFEAHGALAFGISIPATGSARTDAYERVLERVRALPGVDAAGATSALPLSHADLIGLLYSVAGQKNPGAFNDHFALTTAVTPGYFEAMAIPLIAGRRFTDRDTASAPRVAIVNRTLARRFGEPSALVGQRLTLPGGLAAAEIVGVVEDVRQMGPGADAGQQIFLPHPQMPARLTALVLRTNGPPRAAAGNVRSIVASVDPSLAVYDLTPLDALVRSATGSQRRLASLIALFALISVALAGVSAYAALAQFVAERRHEIGVRVALGAQPPDVVRLIFGQSIRLAAIGIVCGTALSAGLLKVAAGTTFGVQVFSADGYLVAAVTLLVLCALAGVPAAVAALRVDPVVTLRDR